MKTLKIETIHDAKQACFNGSVRGLSWQKWEQSKIGSSCALKGYNGCHCAIGWLVPPERYNSLAVGALNVLDTGMLPEPIMVWYFASSLALRTAFRVFLADLQIQHDRNSTPEYMQDAFRKIGHAHELSWPTLMF